MIFVPYALNIHYIYIMHTTNHHKRPSSPAIANPTVSITEELEDEQPLFDTMVPNRPNVYNKPFELKARHVVQQTVNSDLNKKEDPGRNMLEAIVRVLDDVKERTTMTELRLHHIEAVTEDKLDSLGDYTQDRLDSLDDYAKDISIGLDQRVDKSLQDIVDAVGDYLEKARDINKCRFERIENHIKLPRSVQS
jgi:hypothetical protein